jgi:hypothetical protein
LSNGWRFYRHMPVYLSDGRWLGRTEEVSHAVEYIHVQSGRILVHDWYIPATAIAEVGPGGVRLNVDLEEVRERRWNIPPEDYLQRQGLVAGYDYTSPEDVSASAAPAEVSARGT